ncbi:hypothetical protein ACOMHN_001841 [Nucella lapillus]
MFYLFSNSKRKVQQAEAIPNRVRFKNKDKVVTINITRYGNNLCHECTTTVMACVVQKKRPCVFNKEGDVLVSNTTAKTINFNDMGKDDDAEDDDDDDMLTGEDGETEAGKRRRRSAYRGGRRRRRRNGRGKWREWNNNSYNSSSNDTKDADGKWHGRQAMCRFNVTKRCWEKRCVMKCCDGSPMDPKTNGCKESKDGGLVDSCMNGGTVNKQKTHCQCPEGFSGLRCQNRKCSVKCQNGGICQTKAGGGSGGLEDTTHNDDHCVCPLGTKGKFCEEKECTMQCKNNGTCQTNLYSIWSRAYCNCKKGFHGSLCENGGVKEGQCPKRSALQSCNPRRWRYQCNDDKACPGTKKCCTNACYHRVCVYPSKNNATCTYRNETYNLGTAFKPDPCHLCTCNVSHVGAPQGIVECARVRCPETPKYCTKVITREGDCCPVCEEEPEVAMCSGNYKYPHFTKCPKRMVQVEVDGMDTNMATVHDLGLEAKDCQGQPLKVMYSEEKVMAGRGEDNFKLLTATSSRDRRDNFAECAFHIQIMDPYPPTYLTCPDDLVVPRPGPVLWDVPQAKDNVGLAKPPTSARNPGIKLGEGEYAIEYYTEDFHGNKAMCKFLIQVGLSKNGTDLHPGGSGGPHDHDHDHSWNPHHQQHHQQQQPNSPSHASTAVAVSVTTSLLVIVLIVIAAFFWRRQKTVLSPTARGNVGDGAMGPSTGAMRWNLNAGGSGGVPQYSLPPHNEEVMPHHHHHHHHQPPAYNRVDDMIAGLAATGGQDREAGELPAKSSLA